LSCLKFLGIRIGMLENDADTYSEITPEQVFSTILYKKPAA
jgi:hypothetical protein